MVSVDYNFTNVVTALSQLKKKKKKQSMSNSEFITKQLVN